MISRIKQQPGERLQVDLNLNLNLRGAEGLTEALMQLLTRATLPAQGAGVETTQPSLFSEIPAAAAPAVPRPSTVANAANTTPIDKTAEPPPDSVFLAAYQTLLKASKQRKAGEKAVKDHETSARQFDQWRADPKCHRFSTR